MCPDTTVTHVPGPDPFSPAAAPNDPPTLKVKVRDAAKNELKAWSVAYTLDGLQFDETRPFEEPEYRFVSRRVSAKSAKVRELVIQAGGARFSLLLTTAP